MVVKFNRRRAAVAKFILIIRSTGKNISVNCYRKRKEWSKKRRLRTMQALRKRKK